jgi:hypothetical protein
MTERKPDDGRNERQRQRDEERARQPREHDDGRSARQRIEEEKQDPDRLQQLEEERQRPDYIERSRPDDPSPHFGQLTRDNVNPDIPSAPPGEGDIVDPHTLGMPQGGIAPPETPEVERRLVDEGVSSINEPEGSQVQPPPDEVSPGVQTEPDLESRPEATQTKPPPEERKPAEPLPSEAELSAMTRADLDELAEERGLDPDDYGTKAELVAALKKDARRRK